MTRATIAMLALLFLSVPLRADGLEFALGLGILNTTQGGPAYPGGDPATALQLRIGGDHSPSYLRMTQWQFQAQSGSNADLRFTTAGGGLQRSWWSRNHGFEGALGTELRVERYEGHASLGEGPSPLDGQVAWMVRPWLRGQIGFRGILIPLHRPSTDLLALLTRGGHYSHPFTRLEVAVPLWNQGGTGPAGALLHMAPRFEISIQFGMRFGSRAPGSPIPES